VTNSTKDTFNFHFQRLEQHATRLQRADVDIDQLESMIKEAKESKTFCEQRIEAVRQSLNTLLDVKSNTDTNQ